MPRGAKSRMRRTETPKSIWIKFCMVVDIPDVVTYTNFGDHRLRGFWVAGGQISPSPIDFHRRPYNTLALPCERVRTYVFLNLCCQLPNHNNRPTSCTCTRVGRAAVQQQLGLTVL